MMPIKRTMSHKDSNRLQEPSERVEQEANAVIYRRLNVSFSDIVAFCDRWHIQEFSLFGSVIRDDFRADSDIDVLVVFKAGAFEPKDDHGIGNTPIALVNQRIYAQAELEAMFGRKVDLTEKHLLKNPFSRQEILRTHRILYPLEQANCKGLVEVNRTMTDNARNGAALLDMVKAMEAIQRFLAGRNYEIFLEDELFRSAVERQLEILGEAANRVTKSFQMAHPEVDWSGTIGLRNVIIHQYDQLQYETIWQIITVVVPTLLPQVKALVPPLP